LKRPVRLPHVGFAVALVEGRQVDPLPPRLHPGVFPGDAAGDAQAGYLDLADQLRRAGESRDVERWADVDVVSCGQVEDALGDEAAGLVVEVLPLVFPQDGELDPVNRHKLFQSDAKDQSS
jgi:hypothetical protein